MKESIERHISFAGCGFIGIYHVGVSAFLKKYSSHLLNTKIGGSSAGAMCALALVSGDISLEEMTRNVLMLAHQASNKLMGPFNPTFNLHQILVKYFEDNLSEDVATKVSGRLFVSLTKARNKKNVLVSEFSSKADLIEAVCASCFVPVMSGWRPPVFRGQIALDGGYSDNIPALGGHTLTVSPFAGDAAICPDEEKVSQTTWRWRVPHGTGGCVNVSRENLSKLGKAMIPPNTAGMLALCCQGWSDARRFLLSEKLVRCMSCSECELSEFCEDCTAISREAKENTLPQELLKVFEEFREKELRKCGSSFQAYVESLSRKLVSTLIITMTPTIRLKGFRPTIESCPFVNF